MQINSRKKKDMWICEIESDDIKVSQAYKWILNLIK